MAAPQDAAMAPGLELVGKYVIRVTAIDATTGNTVSGVKVQNVAITGQDLTGDATAPTLGTVTPEWISVANDVAP